MKRYILFMGLFSLACIRQLNLNYKPTLENTHVQSQDRTIQASSNRDRENSTDPAILQRLPQSLRAGNRQDPDDDRGDEQPESTIFTQQDIDNLPKFSEVQLGERNQTELRNSMGCSCSVRGYNKKT